MDFYNSSFNLSNYSTKTNDKDKKTADFDHEMFRHNWRRSLRISSENEITSEWLKYDNQTIYVLSDLTPFLRAMDRHPDDRDANQALFSRMIHQKELPAICLNHMPATFTWYNSTKQGINLRPGRIEGSNQLPKPAFMGGPDAHALVVGTTGSGKSVFLHALILNLMVEYPPWELELYLADFKRVEMSKYVNNNMPSPHVKACAATREISYVESLIRYIKKRKDDRETFFQRMGLENIENFRNAYPQVVMPRILFLVDEFQQLFLDASMQQKSVITDYITDLTRTGRASGVHLLFASQDMQGALSQNQMTNFNMRFALRCTSSISNDILGDSSAENLSVGQVILKNSTTKTKYSVPNTSEKYLDGMLNEFYGYANGFKYSYRETQKYYDEYKQNNLDALEKLLNHPAIRRARLFEGEEFRDEQDNTFMTMALGRKVVYAEEKFDIESIYMDYSKNRSLLCLSGSNSDLAYFQKMIGVNMRTMNHSDWSLERKNRPFALTQFYDLNPQIASLYPEEERLKDFNCLTKDLKDYGDEELDNLKEMCFCYRAEELEYLHESYSLRKNLLQLLRNPEFYNAKELCREYLHDRLVMAGESDEEEIAIWIDHKFEMCFDQLKDDDSNLEDFIQSRDLSCLGGLEDEIRELFVLYYRYKKVNIRPVNKIFQPTLVLISGIENLERPPRWLSEVASNGLDYNLMVLFFSTTGVHYDIKQASNYIFVAGDNPKLYDDYAGMQPQKGDKETKFACWVKNTNQKFFFKKYRCKMNQPISRSLNFDDLIAKSFCPDKSGTVTKNRGRR